MRSHIHVKAIKCHDDIESVILLIMVVLHWDMFERPNYH